MNILGRRCSLILFMTFTQNKIWRFLRLSTALFSMPLFCVFLKLFNYPEKLKEDEVLDWRAAYLKKWSLRFFGLGLAIMAYAFLL